MYNVWYLRVLNDKADDGNLLLKALVTDLVLGVFTYSKRENRYIIHNNRKKFYQIEMTEEVFIVSSSMYLWRMLCEGKFENDYGRRIPFTDMFEVCI